MNKEYEKELNRVCLHINIPECYEEDYQMPMLRENEISGILEVSGYGIDGESRYTYGITGLISMEVLFENKQVGKNDIQEFVACLLNTVKELHRYMLNPGCLLLEPEYIFYRKQKYYFCYLPVRETQLCESFHHMTEYFVKKLDYQDGSGITLAYELHKATLQENYDLEQIMEEYQEEQQLQEETQQSDVNKTEEIEKENEMLFTLEDEDEEYTLKKDTSMVRESGGVWSAWKKAAHKISRGRIGKWGSWDDLILETDGQGKHSHL